MKVPTHRRIKQLPRLCAACGEPIWSRDLAELEKTTLVVQRAGSRDRAPEGFYHPECAPPPPRKAGRLDHLIAEIDATLDDSPD